MTLEIVVNENARIRSLMKEFSSLLNVFLDKKKAPKKNSVARSSFSLEVLQKRCENDRKLLATLSLELGKTRKQEARMQKTEELDPKISNTKDKIKALYSEIHEINLKRTHISKELLETSDNTARKAEAKRLDNEIQRIEQKNRELKFRNSKIEEKIDKVLVRYDESKEKLQKAQIVAETLKICLSSELKERYDEIQQQIKGFTESLTIKNKHDELTLKALEKSLGEIKAKISETESQITDIETKIKEQEHLLSDKSQENEKVREVLARNTDPRRLFLEKDVRKKPVIVKELVKPASLIDLNKKNKDHNNDACLSIEKGLQKREVNSKSSIFTVPFRIKPGKPKKSTLANTEKLHPEEKKNTVDPKVFQENFNKKYQIDEKSTENRVWSLPNEENYLKTEPVPNTTVNQPTNKNINQEIMMQSPQENHEPKSKDQSNDPAKPAQKTFNFNQTKTNPEKKAEPANEKPKKGILNDLPENEFDIPEVKTVNTNQTKKIDQIKKTNPEKKANENPKKGIFNDLPENEFDIPEVKTVNTNQTKKIDQIKKTNPEKKANENPKKGIFNDLPENEFEIPEVKTVNNGNNEKSTKIHEGSSFEKDNAESSILKGMGSPVEKKKNLKAEAKNDFFEGLDV